MNHRFLHPGPSGDLILLPIEQEMDDNQSFFSFPEGKETLEMSVEYYHRVGYQPPWIGYFVQHGERIVGSAGYKGPPREGRIEIAYGAFEPFRQKGLGGAICRALTRLALTTDPSLTVTARTLPEINFSSRILEKNGFRNSGIVIDPDDGPVWEWVYERPV